MTITGKSLVKIDLNTLIKLLNQALADEWLAYYQYWVGAKVVKGQMSEAIIKELEEHAEEELKHANMLTERIIQLDGVPILDPKKWLEEANCKYLVPSDFASKKILEQNITGERCAIAVYDKLLNLTKDKDVITYHLILEILKEEVEHESDLMQLLENLNS